MTIIQIESETGQHIVESNSYLTECWLDGYIEVPEQFIPLVNQYSGFVHLTIEDGVLIEVEANVEAWEAWKATLLPEADPLVQAKSERIAQSKTDLETYLLEHPMLWTDGEYYAITAEKQNQLTSKIMAATMAQTMSTDYTLTWNSTGEVCKEWTLPDLYALAFAIDARVTALVTYQQTKEVAMRNAETMEELEAITVNYDEVV